MTRRESDVILGLESHLARHGECYLVGSANWHLPARPPDRDYVTSADPLALGPNLAQAFGGRCIVMDARRAYIRIAAPRLPPVDLAPLAGGSISEDLARRDFTVNAMAAMLPDRSPLLDPFAGRADLHYGVVRQVSASSLFDDPLRVMRAIRLVTEKGFVVDLATRSAMQEATPGLRWVHPERVRMELIRALSSPGWLRAARLYLELELWQALPQWPAVHPDPAEHARHLERLATGGPAAQRALAHCGAEQDLSAEESRALAVIASAIIASDADLETASAMAAGLRLSRAQSGGVLDVFQAYQRACSTPVSLEAAFELVERYGCAAVWAALLADNQSLLEAMSRLKPIQPEVLPDGHCLARALGREAGPWLGSLTRTLRKAVATGEVRTREEALQLARAVAEGRGHLSQPTDVDGGPC